MIENFTGHGSFLFRRSLLKSKKKFTAKVVKKKKYAE